MIVTTEIFLLFLIVFSLLFCQECAYSHQQSFREANDTRKLFRRPWVKFPPSIVIKPATKEGCGFIGTYVGGSYKEGSSSYKGTSNLSQQFPDLLHP